MLNIGVVVHGPQIIDSHSAYEIIELLKDYGDVKARLGGTMGRTAVIDAQLETVIDISHKLLPSQSVNLFVEEKMDVIFLLDYGKSQTTGHAFGFKVYNKSNNPPLIQIERPKEKDGTIIPWNTKQKQLTEEIAQKLKLKITQPEEIIHTEFPDFQKQKPKTHSNLEYHKNTIKRKIAGVNKEENIFVNGIVIGKATSENLTIITQNNYITQLTGGLIKEHGVEKLGKVDIQKAIVKTGLLRRSQIVEPRILTKETNKQLTAAFLDHAAEDVYSLKDNDIVVTIGDDTTLIASDILYRFSTPIIGITDGDLDKVVEKGFQNKDSMIIELDHGWDDIIGIKIYQELFNSQKTIKIDSINDFKDEIIRIINQTPAEYIIQ